MGQAVLEIFKVDKSISEIASISYRLRLFPCGYQV